MAAHSLGISWPLAIVLGSATASTDAILLRGLVQRKDIAGSTRHGLQLESGLNDIVLLPVLLLAMHVEHLSLDQLPRMLFSLFVLGPFAGVLVGMLAVRALVRVRDTVGVRRDYESIYSVGVALSAYACAEMLGGSGFLAAFAAGLTIAWMDLELCDCFVEYGETTTEVFLLFCFVLLGSSLIWSGLTIVSAATLLFTFVALFGRTAVAAVCLRHLPADQLKLIAWFGPRGLGTLLLVLLPIFEGMRGAEQLFPLACLVALASLLVHGGSLALLPGTRSEQPLIVSLEQVTPNAILLDVRSDRSMRESELQIRGSRRCHPDQAVQTVRHHRFPPEAELIAFCA